MRRGIVRPILSAAAGREIAVPRAGALPPWPSFCVREPREELMGDKTITKVDSDHSPRGDMGQTYLASGVSLAMRLWEKAPSEGQKPESARDYETVGYVLEGRAELRAVQLEAGDSWVVPRGSRHTYRILERFKAVEATHPPAHVHGRDERPRSPGGSGPAQGV